MAKGHGELRQSQLITTFGPGSLLDLPQYSVIVGGLDDWNKGDEVHEPRLAGKVRQLLDMPTVRFFTPPVDSDDPGAPPVGITVWQFPEWFITQDVEEGSKGRVRTRLLVHRRVVQNSNVFVDEDRRRRQVVPVRFVRGCPKGHVGDIDWRFFVHADVKGCNRQLRIEERGTSGDLSEVWVACACGRSRSMTDASMRELHALGHCDGKRPWLGAYADEGCKEFNRLLVRSASNAWFPQVMSVISLPDRNEKLSGAVTKGWEQLEVVESAEELKYERKKPLVKSALEGFSDDEVLVEIKARKGQGETAAAKSVKQAEIEILNADQAILSGKGAAATFSAELLPKSEWDAQWMTGIGRVVLIHRLREVMAIVGFTRFEPSSADIEGELEIGVARAALAREPSWFPAIENRGEGVFLGFSKDAIEDWKQRPEVEARGQQLRKGYEQWLAEHPGAKRTFPELPYLMLHSLSHLLITSVALECGYPASSIRERVYAQPEGYGILLYTATSDAEGTLGGLIDVGRQISSHIRAALEMGGLCSNDPVCSQHEPANAHERRFLSGAACHGCLLIAETSCEQHNEFLDRALVVPTLEGLGAEFFRNGGS